MIPEIIPAAQNDAVIRALQTAFGVSEFQDITQLTKGNTQSLVFRIVVADTPYLLRIIVYPSTAIGPERHFTCLRAAADAGIAPKVWYTSIEDGLSITDFIEEVPFPITDALMEMPAVLRKLHALAPFPSADNAINTTCTFLLHAGPAVDGFLQKLRDAGIFSPADTDAVFARYAQMAAIYPHDDANLVPCHNDLFKPDNILFDGHRTWLVDWEAAFQNDRYADLAVVANMVAVNEEEEHSFLHAYFGHPPDDYQIARLYLMQQLTHMFYAAAFLMFGPRDHQTDTATPGPDFPEFHKQYQAGEINFGDSAMRGEYGRFHRDQLLRNIRDPRFDEALNIVAARNPRAYNHDIFPLFI